ncbi:MAG: discoidin domain-containing protein [Clostridia bacterium]|nr:discoidin domain-containing protein [Clostridia bacterium]
MKKLGAILLVVLMTIALSAVCYAATGEELLKSAEMYLTFEDTYADVSAKHEIQVDGDDPEFVEGRFGKAAAIHSGDGALYTEDLKFETNSFTVTTWVNVHEHDSDPCLFANKDWNSGANIGFLLSIRGSDWKYNCNADGASRTDTEYPYEIAGIGPMENQWYHIAMVVDRDAQMYYLYINGVPQTKGTSFAANGHEGLSYDDEWNEYPFYIGEDGTGIYNMSRVLNFDIDEFAVFFSALSAEDVTAIYTYAPEGYEAAEVAEAKDLHIPLPEFSVDPAAVLDSADVYLSFDDGITDAKGHTVRQEGEVETVDGISGKAVKIDSDKGHLAIDDYKFGADSFTVTAWIYGETASDDPCLFSNKDWDSSSNPGWLISQRGGDWRYAANASGYEKVDKTFNYALIPEDSFSIAGQWYQMALVVDREAQQLRFYINGRPYYEPVDFGIDHADASYDTEYPFVIGEDGPEKYTTNNAGVILSNLYDEIAIFKKALTGEEVAALYSLNMQEEAAAPAAEEPADPNAPAILWDFNADGAMDANMGANSGANAVSWTADADDAGNEYYTFTASGSDPYVSVDLSAADVSDVVWAKARVKNAGPATALELFGHTDGRGLTGSECTHINVGTDGEWHTYIIYIPDENVTTVNAYKDPQYAITEPYWAGTVDWIRLDPMWQEGDDGNDAGGSMNDGDQIMIDYVAFFSSEEAAKAFRSELDSEYTAPAEEAPAEEPAAESKGLATVEEAAAGKNIITGYEFVSGSNGFGGEGPENLWDGDTGTKFCTNEFPVESIAKLDGTYDITGFTMATANDNADYNGRSPSDWTISVSADGENWTELAKGDDSFFEETNFTYYAGEGTASGVSYVKFSATATPANLFQVSEVTLFGDKAADVTEELATKEEAPQTFDFGIVAAVAAVVSLAGFAISKKH